MEIVVRHSTRKSTVVAVDRGWRWGKWNSVRVRGIGIGQWKQWHVASKLWWMETSV